MMIRWCKQMLCALLLGVAAAATAQQQAPVPSLIRVVVPVAPGASTDIIARKIAPLLAARLGSNVIVENRAGASGFIGASAVAKGPKDGSMLLLFSTSMVTAGATSRNPPLDVVNELQPVGAIMESPLVVVVSSQTSIRTPADLLAAAHARPGQITHGHGGVGTMAHVAAAMLEDAAGIHINHIAYKGAAPAVADMAGGTIDLIIATHSTVAAQIRGGRGRLIGVTTAQPHPNFPGVPTMASVAPGYAADLWVGLWTTPGTPAALVQRYNRELNEVLKTPEVKELLQADASIALPLTPEQFGQRVRQTYDGFKRIATTRNIVVE